MVQLQLKAKHLFYIANLISLQSIYDYLRLITEIKNQITATYTGDDEDLITVLANSGEIIGVFNILASLPEGQVSSINNSILDLIIPQFMTGVTNGDPEWISIYNGIENGRGINKEITANRISQGKSFLGFENYII